jgi:hypothetical protein
MRQIQRTIAYVTKPVLAALLAGAFPAASTAQTPSAVIDDRRVSPEQFVLFPWDRLPGGKGKFSEAYECGFNVAGFVPAELLDEATSAGLKAFVTDPLIEIRGAETLPDDEITSRVRAVSQKTRSHPAVFGYHLLDEPEAKLFPLIAKWVKAFHAEAPDAIIYTNLLPRYGPNPGPGGPFEQYLSSFMKTVHPKAFSYDHYALFEDGSLRDAYFPNLETARKVSLESGIPFWHIVLGNAHFNYAEPTEATCRFQAYTSLAYGARGIGWFTYQARERGNYRRSAIDHYGRRTDTFGYIRDANLQMHRLAPTLSSMKSINVFHHPPAEGMSEISSSHFLEGLEGKGPFLIGEFEGKDQRKAVLIVNKGLVASTSFRPWIKAGTAFLKISATSGESTPWSAENNWLAPGQGMLLILN